MSQESKPGFFEETQHLIGSYLKDRLLLVKLQATQKAAQVVSLLVNAFVLFIVGFFILLLLSALAIYFFIELTGSFYYGIGIVTLIYILAFVGLLIMGKKVLQVAISNMLVRIIFDKKKDDDDDSKDNSFVEGGAEPNK